MESGARIFCGWTIESRTLLVAPGFGVVHHFGQASANAFVFFDQCVVVVFAYVSARLGEVEPND